VSKVTLFKHISILFLCRSEEQLDFQAMDEFMDIIIGSINEHGARAVRVFPPASQVLLLFSERLAAEVVSALHPESANIH